VETFAGQKFHQAQLPSYCRNIKIFGGINLHQRCHNNINMLYAIINIGQKFSPDENFHTFKIIVYYPAAGIEPITTTLAMTDHPSQSTQAEIEIKTNENLTRGDTTNTTTTHS
jgi:hypothetical protein